MSTPTATKQVKELLGDRFGRVTSPSLRLEKLVVLEDSESRAEEIDRICDCANCHALLNVSSMTDALGVSRGNAPAEARTLAMTLQSRLIVNQAGGILENAGLCLHRHFGFPVIPGTAVKGCARHAAWQRWKEAWDSPEEEATTAADLALKIALTFGYSTNDKKLDDRLKETGRAPAGATHLAGCVAFLPAWPRGKATLVADIVNCHHPDYYAGRRDRAVDDENPIPNYFPAVDAGATFEFVLLPVQPRAANVLKRHGFDPLQFAEECLREALEEEGIGAKTAAGYGWLAESEDSRAARKIEELEREKKRREKIAKQDAEAKAAEIAARKAELEEQEKQKQQQEEEQRLKQARNASFADVGDSPKINDLIGTADRMLEVREAFTESEKQELRALIVQGIRDASKRERRKWLSRKRGKALWQRARVWLGEAEAVALQKEVGAR